MSDDPAPRLLEGSLVRLRPIEAGDVDALNPQFDDPEVLEHLVSVPFPQPTENFEEFRVRQAADPAVVNFTIVERATDELVGICGLDGIGLFMAPELGLWIGKAHWDKGLGTDTVRTLCRHAFATMGLHRVTLHVLATNARAQRAYEKVGFVLEGTMREDTFTRGAWRDVHVMGLLADAFGGGGMLEA